MVVEQAVKPRGAVGRELDGVKPLQRGAVATKPFDQAARGAGGRVGGCGEAKRGGRQQHTHANQQAETARRPHDAGSLFGSFRLRFNCQCRFHEVVAGDCSEPPASDERLFRHWISRVGWEEDRTRKESQVASGGEQIFPASAGVATSSIRSSDAEILCWRSLIDLSFMAPARACSHRSPTVRQ